MKRTIPFALLATLFIGSFAVGHCQQPNASNASTQSASKRMKKMYVSIVSTRRKVGCNMSGSFPVGPKSQPNITVFWNGYGFIGKEEGKTIWQISDDMAFGFGKYQTAEFTIKKRIGIVDKNGSFTRSTSITATVKRGVPATF